MTNINHPANGYRAVLILLYISLMVICGDASAQWAVTDEQTHTALNTSNNHLDEMQKLLDKMYNQQHVSGIVFDATQHPTLRPKDEDFKTVGEDDNVSDRCPEGTSNPLEAKQNVACKNVVRYENKLYNYLVNMLTLSKDRQTQLEAIIQEREAINENDPKEVGKLQSNTNRLLTLTAQQQIDQMNLKLTLASYDRYFKEQQLQLTKLARDAQTGGTPSLGGSLTKGLASNLALKAALALAPTISDSIQSIN